MILMFKKYKKLELSKPVEIDHEEIIRRVGVLEDDLIVIQIKWLDMTL